MLTTSGTVKILAAGALCLHVAAASGDVALLELLRRYRGERLYTWDDQAAGESWFVRLR